MQLARLVDQFREACRLKNLNVIAVPVQHVDFARLIDDDARRIFKAPLLIALAAEYGKQIAQSGKLGIADNVRNAMLKMQEV